MATWEDVTRLALAMPEATEQTRANGLRAWCVKDKFFVWERPLRKSDLAALGDAAPKGAILGARVEHLIAKEAMVESEPEIFFTTPHFDNFPAVLIRLGKIGKRELREVIVEAWLARAPKRLAKAYVETTLPRRA